MLKLKILKYEPTPMNHFLCESQNGTKHRVDILVDGNIKIPDWANVEGEDGYKKFVEWCHSLAGRTIKCDRLTAFEEIAHDVVLVVEHGTCSVCYCTEARACQGGCSWADVAKTVCSRCVNGGEQI